jgi:hypothetical protein
VPHEETVGTHPLPSSRGWFDLVIHTHLSSGVVPNVVRGIRREVWSWLKILQDSTDFGDDTLSEFNDRLM